MDQYIGKMLDNRYEILERIGVGGMAVVYKARCHRLNRLVAIKILKPELASDAEFRRRFQAESQAVAMLSHVNIVGVYDVCQSDGLNYIVMELIDGMTLKQYMQKRGTPLKWQEALHFISQVLRALDHAHSRGIIHRDIKPHNILVLRDGSIKVADFGIARLTSSQATLTQEAIGSVHYISPEQAKGSHIDGRSDLYSVGVMLYEMLTGRLPFEGDSAVSVAIQHLSSIPLAPREINPDIPEQLELICMKAMAPDLDRRYPSADAMIADLEAFRKNPGVSLDFELEDLRPEESDEPTRPLRTASILSGSNAQSGHRPARESERERRRYDDYDDDYDRPRRGSNKRNTALIGVAVVLAVAVIVVLFRTILGSFGTAPTSYVVPDLLGCTEEEAKELPEIKDIFKIAIQGTEFSDKYEKGEICRQDPEEGEERQGDNLVIKVWVSDGEDTGEMINGVGQSQRGAVQGLSTRRRIYDVGMRSLIYIAAAIVVALLVFLLGYILYRGLPNLSWQFLTAEESVIKDIQGIGPAILNTLYVILATLIVVLPLGVGAAIYLTEYATNRKLVTIIEFATETLTGIPSIIFGLVGMLFFIQMMGWQTGVLAGSMTLVVMILPTIVRTTQESLKTVPDSYREGALALGAGKWHMVRTVVLPNAVDGIVTGCILAVGRIVGESAALLYTAGFGVVLNDFVTSLQSASGSLTVALYMYSERGETAVGFGIATILMLLTLLINLAATLVGRKLRK